MRRGESVRCAAAESKHRFLGYGQIHTHIYMHIEILVSTLPYFHYTANKNEEDTNEQTHGDTELFLSTKKTEQHIKRARKRYL